MTFGLSNSSRAGLMPLRSLSRDIRRISSVTLEEMVARLLRLSELLFRLLSAALVLNRRWTTRGRVVIFACRGLQNNTTLPLI